MASAKTAPLRTYLTAGLLASLVAVGLAHAYRGAYLALGGTPFAEINLLSTTLASVVPVMFAAVAYRFAQAWIPRARAVFSISVLALGILSTLPSPLAPTHPGFAILSAPLHILVSATIALVIPAWIARSPSAPPRGRAATLDA